MKAGITTDLDISFGCFSLKNQELLFCAHNRKISFGRTGLKFVILNDKLSPLPKLGSMALDSGSSPE